MGHYGSTTWKVWALAASIVYGLLDSKIIYETGEDDWRGKDNTKLKYLEVA